MCIQFLVVDHLLSKPTLFLKDTNGIVITSIAFELTVANNFRV
jgi:hypothetical protein